MHPVIVSFFWSLEGGKERSDASPPMPGRPGTVDTVRPSSGEGSYRVMNLAIFQSGTAHGRRPSYSCVNVDSGSLFRTVQLPGCWQYRVVCGKGKIVWEEQLLTHVEAGPARTVPSASHCCL